jgi:hypothetical protein
MPKYEKTTILPGQTISSGWGNNVQTQHEKVVGVTNADVTEIKAALIATDTRTTDIVRGQDGVIVAVTESDQGSQVLSTSFERVGGQISTITVDANGVSVFYTVNRTNGRVTSITKDISLGGGGKEV